MRRHSLHNDIAVIPALQRLPRQLHSRHSQSLEQSDAVSGVSSEGSDDQRRGDVLPAHLQAWAIGLDGSYKLAKAEPSK